MMNRILTKLVICTALFLSACGGGGGDGLSIVGIDRIGVSNGTVTGFGSIFVNGVEFETNSAEFTIDDSPGSENGLSVGDVVVVSGSIDANGVTGTADAVFAEEAVEGPIDSIDLLNNRMVVAGQTVIVDASTSFDNNIAPATLGGLAVGNFIEVHGFIDGSQNIRATRVERKAVAGIPAGRFVQVHGLVSGLNAGNSTFSINGLTIDFSTADVNDLPGGVPANGDFVEAKGASFGAGGELIATKVEPEIPGIGDLDPADIGNLEIEGFITRFSTPQNFDVSGFPVRTVDGQTVFRFEDGTPATAADLAINVKVQVKGSVNSSGTLVADSVEIRRAAVLRITGLVDDVPTNDTFVVLGVTIRVDSETRIEDKSNADEDPFSLALMNAGDYVELRGALDVTGAGDIIAERVERDDLDTETILQGFVESVAQPMFTVLGVTVDTTNTLIFRDVNKNPISANDFFNDLDVGDLVKAKGVETSATALNANEEVEFENEM